MARSRSRPIGRMPARSMGDPDSRIHLPRPRQHPAGCRPSTSRCWARIFCLPYTQGDNRNVVATDTMKNFVHRTTLDLRRGNARRPDRLSSASGSSKPGHTWSGCACGLGSCRSRPRVCPTASPLSPPLCSSNRSARRPWPGRVPSCPEPTPKPLYPRTHRCGRLSLQLIKVSGSSSSPTSSATTTPPCPRSPTGHSASISTSSALPRSATPFSDSLSHSCPTTVAMSRVNRCVTWWRPWSSTEFVSLSIQHLVHEMGQRLLARFPQLASVSFEAQNRRVPGHRGGLPL